MMEYLIRLWLRIRLLISNLLNKFDKYNYKTDDWFVFNNAIDAKNYARSIPYHSKYDFGDRLRTPDSVWNRAVNGMLYDDCDGMATLYMACLNRAGECPKLLTIIGTKNFWKGHTVCYWFDSYKQEYEVVDYSMVWRYKSLEDAALHVAKRRGIKGKILISRDAYTNKWVNVDIRRVI